MALFEVRGADQFFAVGAALKSAGGGGLRRELLRGIRKEAKPVIAAARRGAEILPQSGGLAAEIAGSKFSTRTRLTGGGAGVRIVGASADNLKRIDAGTVRHPVYGNRAVWATQSVPPGWFTKSTQEVLPAVRAGVARVVTDVARRVEGAA